MILNRAPSELPSCPVSCCTRRASRILPFSSFLLYCGVTAAAYVCSYARRQVYTCSIGVPLSTGARFIVDLACAIKDGCCCFVVYVSILPQYLYSRHAQLVPLCSGDPLTAFWCTPRRLEWSKSYPLMYYLIKPVESILLEVMVLY